MELERQGCEVAIVPVRPGGDVVHSDARELVAKATVEPLLSVKVLGGALAETVRSPRAAARALVSLRQSRNVRIFLKNLAVLPKGLWLARHARRLAVGHLHAHWAGTSATVAMLASEISGISWSLTAHRWDISENNLLVLKAKRACFVRAISERGAEQIRSIVGRSGWSPWVLHMGVPVTPRGRAPAADGPFRVVIGASLIDVKGHRHVIEAVQRLKARGVSVRADFAGDGPLAGALRRRVTELGLEEDVVFLGRVSHAELVSDMAGGKWDAAVLPSVAPSAARQEGIPVFLMEAMACGLPALGTDAGGVPELLRDGAGLLVPPGDEDALADALARLASDDGLRQTLAERGRKRIEEAFSIADVAAALHTRFRECVSKSR